MHQIDPVEQAQAQLLAAVGETLRGGDPNRLRAPYQALLRARGQGKAAKAVDDLPVLPYVKPQRRG